MQRPLTHYDRITASSLTFRFVWNEGERSYVLACDQNPSIVVTIPDDVVDMMEDAIWMMEEAVRVD